MNNALHCAGSSTSGKNFFAGGEDHSAARAEPVHFCQQLVLRLLLVVVSPADRRSAARAPQSVEVVDEHDGECGLTAKRNFSQSQWTKSISRQRTTQWPPGVGNFSTISARARFRAAPSFGDGLGAMWSISPADPSALNRFLGNPRAQG